MTTTHDEESRAAIDALVYRLRNRDDETDDEVFAAEFIAALRGRGWRPTEAKPVPTWQEQAGNRDQGDAPSSEYMDIKRRMAARQAHKEAHDDRD